MKAFALVIILLFVIGGLLVFKGAPPRDISGETNEQSSLTGSEYFEKQMTMRAVLDIGQPIEGFDADLLIQAFPGLSQQDFAAVETFEGRYEIGAADELLFIRDESKMVSSAERTISKEGYATLLANLAFRLDMPIATNNAIDAIIDRIDSADQLEARIDEAGEARGVRIIPHEVLEDSRCPIDVACIQAGTVRVRATVESGTGPASQIFVLNELVSIGEKDVALISVSPEPESSTVLAEKEYSFRFSVSR